LPLSFRASGGFVWAVGTCFQARGPGRGSPLIVASIIQRRNEPKRVPLPCTTAPFFSQTHFQPPRSQPSVPSPRGLCGTSRAPPTARAFPHDLNLELASLRHAKPPPFRLAGGAVCSTPRGAPLTVTHAHQATPAPIRTILAPNHRQFVCYRCPDALVWCQSRVRGSHTPPIPCFCRGCSQRWIWSFRRPQRCPGTSGMAPPAAPRRPTPRPGRPPPTGAGLRSNHLPLPCLHTITCVSTSPPEPYPKPPTLPICTLYVHSAWRPLA
jgi:hypothetical protein